MNASARRTLWLRWVAANALGEMFGLGLTLLLGAVVISSLGDQQSVSVIFLTFLVAVASGAIEATLVGLAQWWAMHPWFPLIRRTSWWLATLIGALLAYILGYLPTTLINLSEQASPTQVAATEPEQWVVLLLAAGLGAVGGIVLSFAQWLTMRRKIKGASIWLPANMLAWLVGMPLIFWGIDVAQKLDGLAQIIAFMAGILFLAGLLVGAIHGAFLAQLVRSDEVSTK